MAQNPAHARPTVRTHTTRRRVAIPAILTLLMMLIIPTQAAMATGGDGSFNWDWRYDNPSCSALTVNYPSDIPAGQSNDVNVRIINLGDGGGEVTLNFHNNSGTWNGTQSFKYSEHPQWPGWSFYKVVWTQVGGTNYHWQGEVTCGEKPPTPKDASASATSEPATCTAPGMVLFDIVNATWLGEQVTEPGSYIRVAKANAGHLFANGTDTLEVPYTVEAKLSPQSTDPSAPCYVAPPQTCLDNPDYSYTFDPATGQVVLTVTGGKEGDVLCKPLYLSPTSYSYDQPVKEPSDQASWPQTLFGYNQVTVDKVGTYTSNPPQLNSCYQYDIYASFDGPIVPPAKLTGPSDPNEPRQLHEVLPGKGTNPTYSWTPSKDCGETPPPGDEDAQFTPPTVIDVCGVANDKVELGTSEHGIQEVTSVTPLDDGRVRHTVVFTPNDGFVVPAPGEGDEYTVVDGKAVWELYTTNEPCEPTTEEFTPTNVTYLDVCAIDKDRVVIPGFGPAEPRESYTDSETGISYFISVVEVKNGTYYVEYQQDGAELKAVTVFVPFENVVPKAPGKNDTYTIVNGLAVWQHTFTNEACPVPPKGEEPPNKVDKPVKPAANPVVKTPVKQAAPPVKHSSPSKLATTGAEQSVPLAGVAGALLLLGGAFASAHVIRHRRSNGTTGNASA